MITIWLYACGRCGEQFSDAYEIRAHLQRDHGDFNLVIRRQT